MKTRKIKGTIIWTITCFIVALHLANKVDSITIYPYISLLFIWFIPLLYAWSDELL